MKRALAAGAKKPLLMVEGSLPGQKGEEAALAGLLGALAALYVPLEIRDLGEAKSTKVTGLGWAGAQGVIDEALAIETGRVVCRDIGGSDPERTAAALRTELVPGPHLGLPGRPRQARRVRRGLHSGEPAAAVLLVVLSEKEYC